MIIGFWQNTSGHGCSSVSCVSLASEFVLKYKLNCCIFQTHFNNNNLSHYLLEDGSENNALNDNGIDGLFRLFKTGSFSPDSVSALTNTFYGNPARLDLINGTFKTNPVIFIENFLEHFDKMFSTLQAMYDIVFVDIQAGNSELSKKVLSVCDYVVCGITQEKHMLDHLFKENEFDYTKTMFLVGDYEPALNLNYRNLLKLYKQFNESNLLYLPRCIELANAINESLAPRFFVNYVSLDKREKKNISSDTATYIRALDTAATILHNLIF